MAVTDINLNGIHDDFETDYIDRFGNSEALSEVYTFFVLEYLGYKGEASLRDLEDADIDDIAENNYWQSYIQGSDPFGMHGYDLAVSDEDGLEVVWKVYSSLIDLLSAIQNSAVSLSQGVEYTTKTQSAYNDEIDKINPATGSTSDKIKTQQQIQNLRAARDVESNRSQQWSTAMSSANDASSAQAQLLTSIIQQMSGIISALFR